jgi:prepilin-type N-terminal cleavage/methylation domain-containing protein
MTSPASPRGFTLFETLIATAILVTALAGVAQLFVLSTHLTRQANTAGAALVAAQEKLEILCGLSFGFDASGVAITNPSLDVSPPSSLDEDVAAYVDWIDAAGESSATNENSVFVRRWRVSSISSGAPDAVTVEVCVFRMPAENVDARGADACLSTVRTRQP